MFRWPCFDTSFNQAQNQQQKNHRWEAGRRIDTGKQPFTHKIYFWFELLFRSGLSACGKYFIGFSRYQSNLRQRFVVSLQEQPDELRQNTSSLNTLQYTSWNFLEQPMHHYNKSNHTELCQRPLITASFRQHTTSKNITN